MPLAFLPVLAIKAAIFALGWQTWPRALLVAAVAGAMLVLSAHLP